MSLRLRLGLFVGGRFGEDPETRLSTSLWLLADGLHDDSQNALYRGLSWQPSISERPRPTGKTMCYPSQHLTWCTGRRGNLQASAREDRCQSKHPASASSPSALAEVSAVRCGSALVLAALVLRQEQRQNRPRPGCADIEGLAIKL